MGRLLFLDTETGGLDPRKYSLLSIGIVVWDSVEGVLYKKNILPKHKNYVICQEALKINNFNINSFNKEDFYSKEEIVKLFKEIKSQFFEVYKKIPLAGHNIHFDVSFLRQYLQYTIEEYENLFSYKLVDTYSILQMLIHSGKLPEYISNSDDAFKYFNIKVNGRHTALGDAEATAILYEELIYVIQGKSDK